MNKKTINGIGFIALTIGTFYLSTQYIESCKLGIDHKDLTNDSVQNVEEQTTNQSEIYQKSNQKSEYTRVSE